MAVPSLTLTLSGLGEIGGGSRRLSRGKGSLAWSLEYDWDDADVHDIATLTDSDCPEHGGSQNDLQQRRFR
jgi:hypothetical protein